MAKKAARKGASSSGISSKPDVDAAGIRLVQPDRSGPSGATLLDFAGEQNLFEKADARQRQLNKERGVANKEDSDDEEDGSEEEEEEDDEEGMSPRAERVMDTLLWCVSLSMLHFTLDVLVQNQYAVEVEWHVIVKRALQALVVFSLLFHQLHRHASDPRLLFFRRSTPLALQDRLRQTLFFVTSTLTGCYLVYISNEYSYMAVMKQAPPLGCLWIWSVIEMDLLWAVPSLALAVGFTLFNGYGY